MAVVEGNIGNGKTFLTTKLSEYYNAKPFYEPVKSNPYLELYYQDRKRYALPMQFYLMSNRYEMHLEGIHHVWKTGGMCFFDRGIYGDYVFAKKNWIDGNMSDLDFENYNKMRKVMLKSLMVPHIIIYLKCDPEISLKRIMSRGRGCEKGIPLEYLKGLNDLYKELMYELKELGSNIIELDWNEFRPLEYVVERITPYLSKPFGDLYNVR